MRLNKRQAFSSAESERPELFLLPLLYYVNPLGKHVLAFSAKKYLHPP